MYGIRRHYEDVHAWLPEPRALGDVEHHLAGLLFCLDSAMECLVYGLNAIGFAAAPADFMNVTDGKALRKINPGNIVGRTAIAGYDSVFPNLKVHWIKHVELIGEIAAQHDVSKHRSLIFSGGKMRDDPPPGFFETLKIENDPGQRAIFSPMAEIILRPDPKAPPVERVPTPRNDQIIVEQLVPAFRDFFNESLNLANADARDNISLKHNELRP